MTSSTASRTTRGTTRRPSPALLRVLLVAGAATAAVPALASAAVADDAPAADPAGTTPVCQDVPASALGREGDGSVPLGDSDLVLVRHRDQVAVEGGSPAVTSLAVVQDGRTFGATATPAGLTLEVYLAGYDHVAVCWEQPEPVVVPDPVLVPGTTEPPVVAEVQVVPETPGPTDGDPRPPRPERPAVVEQTHPGTAARPQVVPEPTDGAAALAAGTVAAATAPVVAPPATAPTAAHAAPAPAPAPAAAARLATTGVAVGPLAAWSGSAVALGAALVLLRSRAARARRSR